MDHHYNHNHNHHLRPAIQYQYQGNLNLCPTCSFSHFPFCPPPPSYYPHPPQPVIRPPHYHPHPYGYPPPSAPNPNWDSHPPPSYYSPNPNNNCLKRPRTDEWEEEEEDVRRLKLIRDHGVALSNPPPHHHHQYPYDGYLQGGGYSHRDAAAAAAAPYHYNDRPTTNGYHHHHHHHHAPSNMDPSRFLRPPQPQPQPLPSSPPPPLPSEPPYLSRPPPSLFPVPLTTSSPPPPEQQQQQQQQPPPPHPYFHSPQSQPPPPPLPHFNTPHPHQPHSKHYLPDSPQPFSMKPPPPPPPPVKPKFIDASHLFRHPHRTSRPDHFVIILRGLPGSGKSYLAKMLRDLEVENGGNAPRIHSLDDYFMTEVEKVEDNDASKSSNSGRNKKPVMKKVMEYCYEPEMEEAYRSSMLKAFKKTVEEGVFTFIIVDDRNLRVADFAQFWATAKRSGYEVYILEAAYKDPVGCAARNVHGFTLDDIEKMAGQWEEASSLYLQLDAKSLFHGDDLKENRIQEVDMDMEDDLGDAIPAIEGREAEKVVDPTFRDDSSSLKDGKRWDAEGDHPTEVRELGKSKWSEDFGEYDTDQTEGMKGSINALSGLIHQYGKERKSVHWGDEVGNTGFSIGAARKVNALSLVIGPGAGYNLKSNPLPKEESSRHNSVEPKKHSVFQEQIRAEHESFKAVFDRRRQRIGGLDVEDD